MGVPNYAGGGANREDPNCVHYFAAQILFPDSENRFSDACSLYKV